MTNSTDKILKEYFFRRADGGAFFDVSNYDDLHDFETFLLESGYINNINREKLNELFGSATLGKVSSFLKGIWDKIGNVVKNGYRQIVSKFKARVGVVEQTIGNHDLEDVFYVTIPAIEEPNLDEFQRLTQDLAKANNGGEETGKITEGAEEATKGYYNEALTCEYIIRKNKTPIRVRIISEAIEEAIDQDDEMIVVQLEDERSVEIKKIHARVIKNENDLRAKSGKKFDELKRHIEMASRDMADYLINTIGSSGGIITEIFLSGQEAASNVEKKADIKLKIRKGGKESIAAYSLKMYSSKTIGLANLGMMSVIEKLIDDQVEIERFNRVLKSDDRWSFSHRLYLNVHAIKARYQKHQNKSTLLKELMALNLTGNQHYIKIRDDIISRIQNQGDVNAIVDILRKLRAAFGYEANQVGMDLLAKSLNSYIQKSDANLEKFAWNLLRVIGFTDKDTNILLSIAGPKQKKAGKTEIIDKHPELDLSNIEVRHSPGTAYATVVNRNRPKEPIIRFNLKEGGKTLQGSVSFASI